MELNDRGQRVIAVARQEALRLKSKSVEPGHLLLGIIREDSGVAPKALEVLNVDLEGIRQKIENLVTATDTSPADPAPMPLSPRVNRTIEAAGEEALKLGHKSIGPEHLLLGLLQEEGDAAAQVFSLLGHKVDDVRDSILQTLALEGATPPPASNRATSEMVEQILREIVKSHNAAIANMIPSMAGVIAMLPGGSLTGKLYRMLLEQIPAVTFITSFEEGKQWVYVSPQIESILGYSPEEWLRNPSLWLERLDPEDNERWTREFAVNLAQGTEVRSAYRFRHRDGRIVWIQGIVRVERDHQNLPRFVQAVGFDVTDIKKQEEDLRQRTLELEVANRERERLEEQISRSQERQIVQLKSEKKEGAPEKLILGSSDRIQHVRRRIEQVAPSDATVLITGETGTGKQLVAQAIHCNSPRANKPFREVNCADFPQDQLEDELFGHVKGAFTSAISDRRGQFEQADGGTLFLDEIGHMPKAMQKRILKILDGRPFQRMGADTNIHKDVHVNVRVICATNRNLKDAIQKGDFHEDLYHRITEDAVEIAPLRDRTVDIPLLAQHFRSQTNRAGLEIAPDTMEILKKYSWPGNVRQLRNAVTSAIRKCDRGIIRPSHLPEYVTGEMLSISSHPRSGKIFDHIEPIERLLKNVFLGEDVGLEDARDQLMKLLIVGAMEKHAGVRRRAAQSLRVSDKRLSDIMDRLGLKCS